MQIALENKKKVIVHYPKNAFKRKNKIEEGGALGLGVKREQKSIDLRAQNMMKGRVEPFVVLIVVQAVRQIAIVPQMTSSQERQRREQKQKIPQMTSHMRDN